MKLNKSFENVPKTQHTTKKVQAKKNREITKFFREIAFLAVFPVQKLIFGHF